MSVNQALLSKMAQTDRVNNADILALFGGGVLGCWFDPSNFSTMFQDEAGTIPLTAAGQFIGKILDKSGNGIHATSPAGKQPTLERDAGGSYRIQGGSGKYLQLSSTLGMNTGFSAFGLSATTSGKAIMSMGAGGYLRPIAGSFGRNNSGVSVGSTIAVKARNSVGWLTNGTTTTTVYDFIQKNASLVSGSAGLNGNLYLGGFDSTDTSISFLGGMHQIILVSGAVSAENQTKILKYIAQKMISLTP